MDILNEEKISYNKDRALDAGKRLSSFIDETTIVGDLLDLDYDEATVLVHDSLRQQVGGLPMGCFLLASRIQPNSEVDIELEDSALILLRVVGKKALPNQSETEKYRLDAGFRATDTTENWDNDKKSDQFTLNLLRHAGIRCKVVGTFRMIKQETDGAWELDFGADISNFYSGQGMKIYKPMGQALKDIVNFTKIKNTHPLANEPVEIGRVRYSSTEIKIDQERENVAVKMEPTDILARRTALLGMSRSGKSNTIKTIAAAIFRLREIDKEKGRVGQLIFDANGEYCNDNPQDSGCLRSINDNGDGKDVVTYGLFIHPNDKKRRLIRINFLGETINSWEDQNKVSSLLTMMFAGKEIINEHLSKEYTALYVKDFINTKMDPDIEWNRSAITRYKRRLVVYKSILIKAGFRPESGQANIKGLFGKDIRMAMERSEEFAAHADILAGDKASWDQLYDAFCALQKFTGAGEKKADKEFKEFDKDYQSKKGHSWKDEQLNGLLSFLRWPGGNTRLGELKERHDPKTTSDYSDEIITELTNGKLVIVDHSVGSPEEIKHTSERIMWKLFNEQKRVFIDPPEQRDKAGNIPPPPDIIVYIEEAHNLLPANSSDLTSIWARIAKEGSKFRIGLIFSTQEPSSILSNILKNTDNWFVAHLNNQDETKELKKYYDFEDFIGQILKAPDTGFIRMRCLSNPYIVPIQVNKFEVNADNDESSES